MSRRVVTGLDAEGKSCILFDGPVPTHRPGSNLIWRTPTVPADNSGAEEAAVPYGIEMLRAGGSTFSCTEFPPGVGGEVFMHATNTIDYLVVLSGEIVLVLETGEVTCGPGTFIVDRGVLHRWRNDGEVTAVYCAITLPAHPVGKGSTI